MSWIESHQELLNHPKVFDLAELMGWNNHETIGRLHAFWWWCLSYAQDGDLSRFRNSQIAASAGVQHEKADKCVESMISAKWIDKQNGKAYVHDWWDYAGRYLQGKYSKEPDKWRKIQDHYRKVAGNHTESIRNPNTPLPTSTYLPTLPEEGEPTDPPPPDGGILDLCNQIRNCRPEFGKLNQMGLENALKGIPLDDARRVVGEFCANMLDALKLPDNPIALLNGYVRKAGKPTQKDRELFPGEAIKLLEELRAQKERLVNRFGKEDNHRMTIRADKQVEYDQLCAKIRILEGKVRGMV